jgi:hypothetical protein
MRFSMSSIPFAILAAAFLHLGSGYAQSPATAPVQTLIDVIATLTAPETEHSYVYLRVF